VRGAGNIGGGVLRRFKVIFDYSRGRAVFEPNDRFHEPDERDLSGIGLAAEGTNFDTIRVRRVLEDSAAARAGIRAGDLLLSVDGRQAHEVGMSRMRELFKRGGTEYKLVLKRDERTVTTRLVLDKSSQTP
jgi:C-terminal processing protease CtpA/Prc